MWWPVYLRWIYVSDRMRFKWSSSTMAQTARGSAPLVTKTMFPHQFMTFCFWTELDFPHSATSTKEQPNLCKIQHSNVCIRCGCPYIIHIIIHMSQSFHLFPQGSHIASYFQSRTLFKLYIFSQLWAL